ncbi:uncharacterized protein MYCFIDRAFT_175755 [Pseudocercospora fijiensis CIRAD86]|uniref:Uncharacterized protein n=1 Tax=Pseudocercospora fijiensis (strain CIRAD86) TaxID=383855 RepID=M2YWZ3_PSEFD|nr:uncharacterized protein MYCFIDRAFT_175755 [Pseudocercospora fijiensis CIRAD86]EME82220.1 hypothetical protein MYCFIDRAFT_175755 [Pseudocercospora fijiensis CIRAD86]
MSASWTSLLGHPDLVHSPLEAMRLERCAVRCNGTCFTQNADVFDTACFLTR